MSDGRVTYIRSKLYDEVWAEPVTAVAKRYGVSDVALAKICRRLAVPLPPRGYWARKAAGKRLTRPRLPVRKPGTNDEITVSRSQSRSTPLDRRRGGAPSAESVEPKIEVPQILERPHPLVASARTHLRRARVGDYGCLERPRELGLRIEVSPASLDRALRLVDTILKEAERRRYGVEAGAHSKTKSYGAAAESEPPRIVVDGVRISFRLQERSSAVAELRRPKPQGYSAEAIIERMRSYRPRSETYAPNGILVLTVSAGVGEHAWNDSSKLRLEDRLNAVFLALPRLAAERRTRDEDHERHRLEQEAEGRRRLARQRQAEAEEARVEAFLETVSDWKLAREIREFVQAVRSETDEVASSTLGFSDNLAWALKYADRIDPIVSIRRRMDERRSSEAGRRATMDGDDVEPS